MSWAAVRVQLDALLTTLDLGLEEPPGTVDPEQQLRTVNAFMSEVARLAGGEPSSEEQQLLGR